MPAMELDGVVFTPVSPKLTTVRYISAAIWALLSLALFGAPLVLMLTGVWPEFWPWLAWALLAVGVVWTAIALALVPRRVRALGYAEREDDLLWRSGILFRSVKAVPYGRLQYVDVEDGPLLRRFDLQKVTLKTASDSADLEIPGLTKAEAQRLREVLMSRGQAKLAGL